VVGCGGGFDHRCDCDRVTPPAVGSVVSGSAGARNGGRAKIQKDGYRPWGRTCRKCDFAGGGDLDHAPYVPNRLDARGQSIDIEKDDKRSAAQH